MSRPRGLPSRILPIAATGREWGYGGRCQVPQRQQWSLVRLAPPREDSPGFVPIGLCRHPRGDATRRRLCKLFLGHEEAIFVSLPSDCEQRTRTLENLLQGVTAGFQTSSAAVLPGGSRVETASAAASSTAPATVTQD
jgi:hypothetical protein